MLLVEPFGVAGVGVAVGVIGVEIALGYDQNFAGMIDGAFVQHAGVEFQGKESFEVVVEFPEAVEGSLCFKKEMNRPVARRLGAALIDKAPARLFGFFGMRVVRDGEEAGVIKTESGFNFL